MALKYSGQCQQAAGTSVVSVRFSHLHKMHIQYGMICNWGIWFKLLNQRAGSVHWWKYKDFISRKILKIFVTKLGECPLENTVQVLQISSFPQGGLSAPGLLCEISTVSDGAWWQQELFGVIEAHWVVWQAESSSVWEFHIFTEALSPEAPQCQSNGHPAQVQGRLWWCQDSSQWEPHNAWLSFKATSLPHWSELVSFMHSVSEVSVLMDRFHIFSLQSKNHLWRLLTATAGLSKPQQGERSLFPQRTDTLWWLHLIKRGCWSFWPKFLFFFGNHSKCSQMPIRLLLPANKTNL